MATYNSRFNGESHATQDKLQAAAQASGIAEALRGSAAQAAPWLALQQSLLGGIVRAQKREAERLAAKGKAEGREGSAAGRVEQARSRAEQLATLMQAGIGQAQFAASFVDTFATPGIFAGLVRREDGSAAADHVVKLQIVDKAQRREVAASGKTDTEGRFRIAWAGSEGAGVPAPNDLGALVEQLLTALSGEDADKATLGERPISVPVNTAPTGTTGNEPPNAPRPQAERSTSSRVQIADAQGTLVFEDPLPPSFDTTSSEYRVYVVPAVARG